MQDYLSSGPKKNTLPLLSTMEEIDVLGKSILDIGGGVGAITFELFKRGIDTAQHVDISKAYSIVFQEEAENRGLRQRIQCFSGDFVRLHNEIHGSDIVVLDKVICCYQHFEPLVRLASEKAGTWIAFSVPRDVWWVRIYDAFENKFRAWKGKPFPTYVHSTRRIDEILREEGFLPFHNSHNREWLIAVYQRNQIL
jgi:magnesium-protoporphyrin O-methyltransferase